jgi:hypothetical protein
MQILCRDFYIVMYQAGKIAREKGDRGDGKLKAQERSTSLNHGRTG